MRRLSRSIFVLCVVAALNSTATLQARSLNDDQDPRGGNVPRIVRVIRQIIRAITKPTDDGGQLIVPKP
jgi:hypothetical protein